MSHPSTPVLMDGTKAVKVSKENAQSWRERLDKDTPIFASEIDKVMLAEWEFAFELGEEIPLQDLTKMSMSKPYREHRDGSGSWGGTTSPCSIVCKNCECIYPLWGRFEIKDKQTCAVCGYVYEFIDW